MEILEMKNITELKKILEGFNSNLIKQKKELQIQRQKPFEIIQSEKQKEKSEKSLRELCNSITKTNIFIMRVLEEEGEKWAANLFKDIMAENFPYGERTMYSHL